jgi:hypothetical protein
MAFPDTHSAQALSQNRGKYMEFFLFILWHWDYTFPMYRNVHPFNNSLVDALVQNVSLSPNLFGNTAFSQLG